MSEVLRKLGDFNEVLEYYQDMLNLIQNMNARGEFLAKFPSRGICYNRAVLNNTGISIAQNFDYIEQNKTQSLDNDILMVLEDMSKSLNYPDFEKEFKKIMTEYNITPFETLKQIRNAFLHGDYELEFGTPNDYKIYDFKDEERVELELNQEIKVKIKGKHIETTLTYPQSIMLLELFYETIRLEQIPKKQIEINVGNPRFGRCKNRAQLNKFLEDFHIFSIIPVNKSITGNKGEIIEKVTKEIKRRVPVNGEETLKSIRQDLDLIERTTGVNTFKVQELNKEKLEEIKQYISAYIQYVGFDAWDRLNDFPYYVQGMVFEDFYGSTFNHTSFAGISNRCCSSIHDYMLGKINKTPLSKNSKLKDQLSILMYETPIAYSNMILGMANYSCGYLKENNNTNGLNLFEYHNLNGLNGVVPTIDRTNSIEKGVDSTKVRESIEKQISSIESQIRNLSRNIESLESVITDKNPNRASLEAEKKKKEEKLLEEQKKLLSLKARKNEYNGTYDDYSEFFRHMRNSIAHGRYSIDYIKALKSKDFSKILFTFRDFDKNDKINPSFEVKLSAKQILKIINGVKEKINTQLTLEGNLNTITLSEFTEIISAEELFKRNRPSAQDLQKSGFITESDKIDSFDIAETTNIDRNTGETTYDK